MDAMVARSIFGAINGCQLFHAMMRCPFEKRCQDLEIRRTGLQKGAPITAPFPFACIDHANQSPYQRRSAGISIRNGSILANIHISTSLITSCHFEEDEAVEEVAEGA